MRLGTTCRMAVDTMVDLALRADGGPVALVEVARRIGVSLSYLEQVVARLRRAGLVAATRGPGGGYALGRDAAAITLADIVGAADDRAPRAGAALAELAARLDAAMAAHMAAITLASLRDEQLARGVKVELKAPKKSAAPARRVPNSVFAFGQSFAR